MNTAPTPSAAGLPPLPEPHGTLAICDFQATPGDPVRYRDVFTADQMQAYALAAIAAQQKNPDHLDSGECGGVQAWQPIETAPSDGTAILGYDDAMHWASEAYSICWIGPSGKWWDGEYLNSPTHWMPLPAAPTGDGA